MHKNSGGCSKFSKGQRVVAVQWPQFEGRGTWQQYVAVKEECLVCLQDVPELRALACGADSVLLAGGGA